MSQYLKIDVSSGRFFLALEVTGGDPVQSEDIVLTNTENPGDLQVSITNDKITISSAITGKSYLKDYGVTTDYKTRDIGSESWVELVSQDKQASIQSVLNRPDKVVVSEESFNLSSFVKPDLTSSHSETTQFVHDGDVTRGGAVILDSNSALIGFQSGTFVKTTENELQGRKYGKVEISVDNGDGSGTPINAIDIVQGNIKQYPDITVNGDVVFDQKVILTSPNGTQYRLNVDNSGNLSTQAV